MSEVGCGSGREHITTLFCGSAVGGRLPPYVVRAETIDSGWTVGGPPSTLYSVSSSGWMETPHIQEWFNKLFLPAVENLVKSGPVILFLDGHNGHNSHTALQLIGMARAKKITIYCLPPHTTHLLQPLDVAVFGPLKCVWRKSVREHKLATNATQISKHVFPSVLSRLYSESVLPEHLVSGFRVTGIHSLSHSAIKVERLKTAIPFVSSNQPPSPRESIVPVPTATPVRKRVESSFTQFFLTQSRRKER